MKRTSLCLLLAALLFAALVASAADKTKEVTLTGDGKCAKCQLKETDTCQNVIQTQEDGKTITYYLEQNKVSKNFHESLCENPRKITVTGIVKEENGRKLLTPSKIKLVK